MQKFKFVGESKFEKGLKIIENYLGISFFEQGVELDSIKICDGEIGFQTKNNKTSIVYQKDNEFFYILMRFIVSENTCSKDFFQSYHSTLGFMVDCSRNAVWNLNSIKDCIVYLALTGYSYLELYTEDTYEIESEPYFGYMRGRYTAKEIKEVDEFAKLFGIELVPCIQTLAHLDGIFKWNKYKAINDVNDILLLRDEKTYELIDKMFKSVSKMFTSKRINIGMDEAMLLGSGQFLHKNGYVQRSELMYEHLNKVVDIAKSYGFTVSMWNDMFFRVDNKGEYRVSNPIFSEKLLSKIPKDVELIYWDYVSESQQVYENMLESSLRLTDNTGFAGGLFSWHSFSCDNDLAMRKVVPAVNACKKYKIKDVLVTTWGDDGAEASRFTCLPTVVAFSDYFFNGNVNLTDKILKKLFNYNFIEFCDISLVNRYIEINEIVGVNVFYGNTAKYMAYNDLLLGLYDNNVPKNAREKSVSNYERLFELSQRESKYSYLFETMASLSKLLIDKADLSVLIKKHYDEKNFDGLKADLIKIRNCKTLLREFIDKYKEQWLKENKPFGFEVNQIRLGGLLERINYAEEVLDNYINGKTAQIFELEEKRLPGNFNTEDYKYNLIVEFWKDIVTCGKI